MKRTALAALVCSAFLACNSAAGAVSTENWESSLKNAPTSLAAAIGEELLLDNADGADKTASLEKPSKSVEPKESAKKTQLKSRQNPIRFSRLLPPKRKRNRTRLMMLKKTMPKTVKKPVITTLHQPVSTL